MDSNTFDHTHGGASVRGHVRDVLDEDGLAYEHFIYGPTCAAVAAVAADLIAAGYLVPDPPRDVSGRYVGVGPDSRWELTAYGSLERAFADGAARADIHSACRAHGARYDGGGVFLAPPNPVE